MVREGGGFPGLDRDGSRGNVKTSTIYFFRTLSVMVALPLIFIVIYPVVYLMLPEAMARLADLPQDLIMVLLVDIILVPVCGGWLYWRARLRTSESALREIRDTRDVL